MTTRQGEEGREQGKHEEEWRETENEEGRRQWADKQRTSGNGKASVEKVMRRRKTMGRRHGNGRTDQRRDGRGQRRGPTDREKGDARRQESDGGGRLGR